MSRFALKILCTLACGACCLQGPVRTAEMPEPLTHKIVPTPERTELQEFAQWFHQDWRLMFPNFYMGAAMYIKQLTPERRLQLQQQLRAFLDANAGATPRELEQQWLKLGAAEWERDLTIHEVLQDFVWMLSDEATSDPQSQT